MYIHNNVQPLIIELVSGDAKLDSRNLNYLLIEATVNICFIPHLSLFCKHHPGHSEGKRKEGCNGNTENEGEREREGERGRERE